MKTLVHSFNSTLNSFQVLNNAELATIHGGKQPEALFASSLPYGIAKKGNEDIWEPDLD